MKLFAGVYTAIVTPFYKGAVDYESLGKILDQQLAAGIAGIVVNGTTAESPTLTEEESFDILRFAKEKVGAKMKVLFGSGTNSTAKTCELSKKAEKIGVDGLLVVVPYYNKPPQAGLYHHFKTVAESVTTPVMLYNVPGRTVAGLNADTIKDLTAIKNIRGIKEATGNLDFGRQIILSSPVDFVVSSGDDETCLELRVLGGQGVVSVCSQIMPRLMAKWFQEPYQAAFGGEFLKAKPLISSLYVTANPIPVKAALHILGVIRSDEMRLPLCTLDEVQKKTLEKQLKTYGEFVS